MCCTERCSRAMYSISHQTWRCHISHQLALHPIQLTPQEVRRLLQLLQAHRTPQAIARRAQIVLTTHAHPDWSLKQLAQSLRLNDRLIRKWRRRWQEAYSLQGGQEHLKGEILSVFPRGRVQPGVGKDARCIAIIESIIWAMRLLLWLSFATCPSSSWIRPSAWPNCSSASANCSRRAVFFASSCLIRSSALMASF